MAGLLQILIAGTVYKSVKVGVPPLNRGGTPPPTRLGAPGQKPSELAGETLHQAPSLAF